MNLTSTKELNGRGTNGRGFSCFLRLKHLWLLSVLIFFSCSIPQPPLPKPAIVSEKSTDTAGLPQNIPPDMLMDKDHEEFNDLSLALEDNFSPIFKPSYQTALDEEMPFDEKLFSFSARSTPLRDVLIALAKEAELNLVLGKHINALEPVSVEFTNLPLRQAMEEILNAFEYSYEINGNMLRVKAIERRIFHFDYPLVYSKPSSSVGGDMLGGSSGEGSGISASFTVDVEIEDEESLNIWKQIKDILKPAEEDIQSSSTDDEDEATPLLSEIGRATVDSASGTIVVFDRPDVLDTVEAFLLRMKESLSRQVLIEAKIIEVRLDHAHHYGVDWSVLGDRLEFPFSLESNLGTSSSGTGTFNFKISNENTNADVDVGALIDFISTQGDVNTISSPRLNVINNQSATISIGKVIPYLDFEPGDFEQDENNRWYNTAMPTVVTVQAGISLGITPQISRTGVITLHIIPVITDQVGEKNFSYEGVTWNVPILDTRTTSTIISARDGETVVLGGLMQDNSSDNRTSVPIFSKIPFIGKALFANQAKQSDKTELVILLTPRIMNR